MLKQFICTSNGIYLPEENRNELMNSEINMCTSLFSLDYIKGMILPPFINEFKVVYCPESKIFENLGKSFDADFKLGIVSNKSYQNFINKKQIIRVIKDLEGLNEYCIVAGEIFKKWRV